jgi:formylglycine-generating enzyme required for sulfatase activity
LGPWEKQAGTCWRNPAWVIEDSQPVVYITWNDAHAYLDWLNKKGQATFRLPTSARWEYACRAGTTTKYPWGDKESGGVGWYNGADQAWKTRFPDWDLAPGRPWNDGYALVAPVGKFKPNAWGLYDMIGNVEEWCEDAWGEFTGKPLIDPSGGDAPIPPGRHWDAMHTCRIVRHGSFNFHPYGSGFYGNAEPDAPLFDLGFRVCREE